MDIERIRSLLQEYLKKPLVVGAICLFVGVLIGWFVVGWGIWPVEWEDAGVQHLRSDLQEEYVRMMIESYAYNQDSHLALTRWKEIGDNGSEILKVVQSDTKLKPQDIAAFSLLVDVSFSESPQSFEATQPFQTLQPYSSDVTAEPDEEEKSKLSPVLMLAILCPLMLVIGGGLFYVLVIRRRPGLLKSGKSHPETIGATQPSDYYEEGEETPIAQFMTTYMLGDDLYDDSFSIDSPSGEFLGECGVGISEPIGVGDPKKVTAFEVWLFDKNDIQTVTKVMMSDHAFNEPSINQRLVSKGEPVLIEPAKHILLETATLQLEVRIVDMNYGEGALPDNSFFERMTLELAVWPRMSE
ncbi:MAG: hypothetical protein MUO76_14995 [Anaerolineaceae bacterium]|nr:hypothetical protein [Anaerolineaceae bacterium]